MNEDKLDRIIKLLEQINQSLQSNGSPHRSRYANYLDEKRIREDIERDRNRKFTPPVRKIIG